MISVCMAAYNGEKYIREQLLSILPQLGPMDEVIVSDDGSSDRTREIVESLHDLRIHWIENHGEHGYTQNFENAMRHCHGDHIFLADQDDVWKPNKVAVMMKALEHKSFAVHDTEMTDEDLVTFDPSQFDRYHVKPGFWHTFVRNRYNGCCMAFTRKFMEKALPFPADHDLCRYDYWLPYIAEFEHDSAFVKESLIYYRRHSGTALNAGEGSSRSVKERIVSRLYGLKELLKREMERSH